MLVELLAVFIGGGIGALLRYLATLMSKKIFFSAICGKFTLSCDAAGEYHIRVFFRNRYGLYKTDRQITIA